ncbi:hypothetical protein ACFYYR_17650 [Streptomyces sp. NPDC001922]|uniref:hypothetical protein n=1 Tax=Streptomyces sp. NPDC001922 TaxID=3364624 RepID=UPI00367A54FC
MAHQIVEAAVFGDAAAIEDVDLVGMPDAVEAMDNPSAARLRIWSNTRCVAMAKSIRAGNGYL